MPQTPMPPAPGVVELRATYAQAQQLLQNVFHVHSGGVWNPANLGALIDAYIAWEIAEASALRSTAVSLVSVRATDLTSLDSAYLTSELVVPIAGTRVSQSLPENVTWAVQASTGLRGRGKQGRVFWIGLTEDQTNGSVVLVSTAGEIIAALNALENDIDALAVGDMVVLHRMRAGVKLNPAEWSEITSFLASDLTTDSQKNRLPNHKRKKRATT